MIYDTKPWLSSYGQDVCEFVEIPDMTVTDRIRSVTQRYPDKAAIHFLSRTLDYRTVMFHAECFARGLRALGCSKGDVVSIGLPNIPQYLVAQLGAMLSGCATSGVSPLLTTEELVFQLNDSETKVWVTFDALFEKHAEHVIHRCHHIHTVVVTRLLDYLPVTLQWLGRMIKGVPHGAVTPLPSIDVRWYWDFLWSHRRPSSPMANVFPDDLCFLQYTGGTTGSPKGTLLTHRSLVANITEGIHFMNIVEGTETVLSGFPFFHLAGLMLGTVALWLAGTQILIPDPRDTRHIVREMKRYAPTVLVNVPSLYLMLMKAPRFSTLDFSTLKFVLSGAAPFPVDTIQEFERIIGEGKVIEVFGLTEASPLITMTPRFGKKKLGTVGIPLPNTRVRIVDIETGEMPVPLGEPGEIIAQGPQMMKGYWRRPHDTATALRKHDGSQWLHTGDIGTMDSDGYITITDRAKDMLIVGGYKVFSREVEEKIQRHPAVELCAVIGIPNPDRPGNDIVKLIVQLTDDKASTDRHAITEDIVAYCKKHLAPYKVPKTIAFVGKMPMTPIGKIDKKTLRKQHAA